jgi:hypothetical protein
VTRFVLTAQGIYYLIAGIWPLVSMATFEAVTGPKTDHWLVHTVGALAMAIGLTLLWSVRHGHIGSVPATLAVTTAMAFSAIDVLYVANGTISRAYLADATIEGVFLAGLLVGRSVQRNR